VDSSLTIFKIKGNLSYVDEIYNPNNFFEQVHHASLFREDSKVSLSNKTIKVHVLKRPVRKPMWHPANVFAFLLQFISIAKANGISLIHGRSAGLSGFLALFTGKLLAIPVIVSVGGNNRLDRELDFRFGNGTWRKLLKKIYADLVEVLVLRNADCVMARNLYTKNYVVMLGVDEKKVKVVSWSLKKDVFEGKADRTELDRFVAKPNIDLKKPIVLYVGRLEPAKQVDVLVDSIPLVLKDRSDAQFVFIGDGSLLERLRRDVEGLNVAKKVFFLGYQPTNVIKAFLSISSVVWIPMSGYVVFEAAAFSAPIVAFDVEWHPEFITDEITGLLVKNRNYRKMAEAVLRMLKDEALAKRCGKRARQKLIEEYDPESLKEKEIKIYEEILSNSFMRQ